MADAHLGKSREDALSRSPNGSGISLLYAAVGLVIWPTVKGARGNAFA